ncbi:MAG: response regulator transcription factor [Candidatus Hydrogenedentes bacterium]|nr:response regulator transcription factor [Candidatus Hydrogenedentota bacterium]
MKVLVVEDEKQIAGFVRKGLEEQGFTVEVCHDGNEGYARVTAQQYDAVVLDIMLPGRDGLSILKNLRKQKNAVPVVLLTARSELDERLEGLNLGADDYLTKPFYVEELIARLHAVTRRSAGNQLSLLQHGDMVVNLLTREVKVDTQSLDLTTRECALLEYLMRSPGRIYTRTQILEHVWGYDFDPSTNLVDVHIQRLRRKLNADDRERYIETARGVGYRFRIQE